MNLKLKILALMIPSTLILLISCKKEVQIKKEIDKNQLVETFFKTYQENPKEAIRNVYKSSEWLKANIKQADTAYVQLNSIINQLGNYIGYEVIKSINVGNSYKIISVLGKYERQPIRFSFILYKPNDKWQIQNFNFDLNIESELEQNITIAFDY